MRNNLINFNGILCNKFGIETILNENGFCQGQTKRQVEGVIKLNRRDETENKPKE